MLTTGTTTSTPITIRASEVRLQRTQSGSCWALRIPRTSMARGSGNTASALMAHAPPFQEVDQHQRGEGNDQQHYRDGRRLAVSKFLEARDDQDRRDVGFVRHVARDENHGAVLANAAGKGQGKAGDQRRVKRGENYVLKRLPARPAQRGGNLFRLRV